MDPSRAARSFGAASETYERGRPDYPRQAVRWILEPLGAGVRRVADVGAGTGKLTRVLVAEGHDVTAVDPDPAMLETLRTHVHGVTDAVVGTAEELPLADESLDAVVLGQAWHWVEPVAACREIARVLRADGLLGMIWNIRDTGDELVTAMNSVMPPSNAELMIAAGDPPVAEPFAGLEHAYWEWTRPMTRAGFEEMARSRSHYLTSEPQRQRELDQALAEVLDGAGVIGETVVDLPYRTHAYRIRSTVE